ncbi:hypothetical protein ACFWFF_14630 [Streptomyces sp. NPDC060223]|uniref:hypothetical protein n=1 Tax=unclassified Streptomyces TaxID=2593676 RepID=UPI0036348345
MTSSVRDVLAERRHQLILRALRSGGPESVIALPGQPAVSPATVRTENTPRRLHADWVFLGTSGVRPGGQVMDTTVVEVPVKRVMIKAGERVVLLAGRAKFPGTGMAKVCGPEELDVVVTNAPVDPATRSSLEEAGVQVVVTGKAETA